MQKIAITGNIASGKSEVEKIIAQYYPVYDTDKIAHKFLQGIDRKELAKRVFENEKFKKELEAKIHPLVKQELYKIFKENENNEFIFVSVPLLFEANFQDLFDKILIVSVKEDIRLERLMIRNNFTKEEALIRIKAQIPESEKFSKCDFVIYNNSNKDELKKNVLKFLNNLKKLEK